MEYKPGLHLLTTLYTERTDLLYSSERWQDFIREQISQYHLTEVGNSVHNFPGGGFTAVSCLTESHILPSAGYSHDFVYSPWLVANITLDHVPESRGYPLCWDNVICGGRSLGYVNAQQQKLTQTPSAKQVITYYLPLDHLAPVASRKYVLGLPHAHWVKLITDDLEQAHPGIHSLIRQVDIWVWGHGMIRPHPGFITGPAIAAARHSGHPNIFFAHSDLSGISIFEEAFYHGNNAANALLASRK